MRVLITGGAGFIGSHLVDHLLKDGLEVAVIDNFDPFYDRALKVRNLSGAFSLNGFQLFEGDIRSSDFLDSVFGKFIPDLVIHLAAKAGVRPSIEQPEEYFSVNIGGTVSLLETMRKYKVRNMLFASSSSVYGNNKKVPFSESDPVDNPISPYAASKKAGELICHTYHSLYDMNIFCLRFFTVYGPRQRPDLAIHMFLSRILNGQDITLFGNGSTSRDYTYVDDIVQGIILAMNRVKRFEIFNLGGSDPITLHTLVSLLEKSTKLPVLKKYVQMQSGDVERTFADITKSQNILGYNPIVSKEEGVHAYVEWFKNYNKPAKN